MPDRCVEGGCFFGDHESREPVADVPLIRRRVVEVGAERRARAREGDRRTSVGRSVGRSVVGDEDARGGGERTRARGGEHRVSVGSLSPGVESER